MEVDDLVLDEKQLDELYLRVYCGLLSDKQDIRENTQEQNTETNDENEDTYSKKLQSRYFEPINFNVRCYKCNKLGHISFDCLVEKEQMCYLCGYRGHSRNSCPNELCFNCNFTGHTAKNCLQPRSARNQKCNRCGKLGHIFKDCKELYQGGALWCQFCQGPHSERDCNSRPKHIFCYNCGAKGHIGDECSQVRMDSMFRNTDASFRRYDDNKYTKTPPKIDKSPIRNEKFKKRKRNDSKNVTSNSDSDEGNTEEQHHKKKKSKKRKK